VKTIFDNTKLNNLKLRNRLFRSATWEGLANPDGTLTDEIYDIYEKLAEGGVGAIVTGLTDVSCYDQALSGNMRLFSDELIHDYKRLTDIVKKYDCRIITQINMSKYVKNDDRTGNLTVMEVDDLTQEDISDIVALYVNAAERAQKAGFDGVQIHAAFGWLLNRFINPLSNHRTDAYGGTAKKRARILIEILEGIREKVPNIHITTKIGYFSTPDDKSLIDDYVEVCRELAEHGIDSMEISVNSPHIIGVKPMEHEAEFLDIALEVKKYVDTPMILVGGHRHIENIERLLNETDIDYFSMSRSLIREPGLPKRWQNGDRAKAQCISCDGCFRVHGKRCVFTQKSFNI